MTRKEYYKKIKDSIGGIAHLNKSALWSMSVIDVMASKKPVVAPDFASFPEILTEKNKDLLFKNKQQFFEILNKILDDKKFREKKGILCRKVSENYSVKEVAKKFIEIIENVGK